MNLTDGPPFNFTTGSDLFVRFSIWNYAVNDKNSSPYPTSVGLQLIGAQTSASALTAIPGSSSSYFAGYLLQGWLQDSGGAVSIPFMSPDAMRLGLPDGSLFLEPGLANGNMNGASPIALIEADAALTSILSERPNVVFRGSSAVIHLGNLGNYIQIGTTGGSSLLSAISEPSIRGAGPVQTSGITQRVDVVAVPEPGGLLNEASRPINGASTINKSVSGHLPKTNAWKLCPKPFSNPSRAIAAPPSLQSERGLNWSANPPARSASPTQSPQLPRPAAYTDSKCAGLQIPSRLFCPACPERECRHKVEERRPENRLQRCQNAC